VIDAELTGRKKMRKFWGEGSPAIANAGLVEMEGSAESWQASIRRG